MRNAICEKCPLEGTDKCETCEKRVCRVCGCTWNNACLGGCYWVEFDLCSECVSKEASGKVEGCIKQRLNLTVDIDEEFVGMDSILDLVIASIETELDCNVIRGKLESSDEVAYTGDWGDEE